MAEQTPIELVKVVLNLEPDGILRNSLATREAFKEVADLNEWYAKRCKWLEEQLAKTQPR